jgi:translocator assembly and maintenance protein 41
MKHHYLWSLSKEGKNSLNETEREELEFAQTMGQYSNIESVVRKSVRDIVAFPAVTQSLKGIVTGGLTKSLKYVGEKLGKQINAKK